MYLQTIIGSVASIVTTVEKWSVIQPVLVLLQATSEVVHERTNFLMICSFQIVLTEKQHLWNFLWSDEMCIFKCEGAK